MLPNGGAFLKNVIRKIISDLFLTVNYCDCELFLTTKIIILNTGAYDIQKFLLLVSRVLIAVKMHYAKFTLWTLKLLG